MMDYLADARMMDNALPSQERPSGQLFSIGQRVRVTDHLPAHMAHFGHEGQIGVIQYSCAQKYRQFGMWNDHSAWNQYMVKFDDEISGWWDGETLHPTED